MSMSPEERYEENPGELPSLADGPLHATSIDALSGMAAIEKEESYGDSKDERAIAHLTRALQHQDGSRGLSLAEVTEKAESLYALLCQQVVGGAAGEQLKKIAGLFGEKPQELRERLSS